jgi:hypothetical protein
MAVPYMERIRGGCKRVPRGHVGPPGPLALAALAVTNFVWLFMKLFGCSLFVRHESCAVLHDVTWFSLRHRSNSCASWPCASVPAVY